MMNKQIAFDTAIQVLEAKIWEWQFIEGGKLIAGGVNISKKELNNKVKHLEMVIDYLKQRQ